MKAYIDPRNGNLVIEPDSTTESWAIRDWKHRKTARDIEVKDGLDIEDSNGIPF